MRVNISVSMNVNIFEKNLLISDTGLLRKRVSPISEETLTSYPITKKRHFVRQNFLPLFGLNAERAMSDIAHTYINIVPTYVY